MYNEYEIVGGKITELGYDIIIVPYYAYGVVGDKLTVHFSFTTQIINAFDMNRSDVFIKFIKDNIIGSFLGGEDILERLFNNLAHQRILKQLVKELNIIEQKYTTLVSVEINNSDFAEEYEYEINRKIANLSSNKLELTTLTECIDYALSEIGE